MSAYDEWRAQLNSYLMLPWGSDEHFDILDMYAIWWYENREQFITTDFPMKMWLLSDLAVAFVNTVRLDEYDQVCSVIRTSMQSQ